MDEFFGHVIYPVIATPKFDGIRCVILKNGVPPNITRPALRSLDDVPNYHIFESLGQCPPGLDGEIMTYDAPDLFDRNEKPRPFYQVQSDVMSQSGTPNHIFHVFDYHDFDAPYPWLVPYNKRLLNLVDLVTGLTNVRMVMPHVCRDRAELEEFEVKCIQMGFEGICWRHYLAKYKYGRSTLREQHLVKMKRFVDDEAVVVDSYEERHNANIAETNALGYKERSSHQANMIGKGRLGGLVVKCDSFALTFSVGSGFDAAQREQYWNHRETLVGMTIKFKYQPHGGKERPRIPIFLGFRDLRDL